MDPSGIRFITRGQLRNSRVPSVEVTAAALQASQAAGIPDGEADYIVIAVRAGTARGEVDTLERRLNAVSADGG